MNKLLNEMATKLSMNGTICEKCVNLLSAYNLY